MEEDLQPANLFSGYYTEGIFGETRLRSYAQWVADVVARLQSEHDLDFVAVSGLSGISVAFAAKMLHDFPVVVVRKGESTHGSQVEGNARMGRYVVLDDLIDTGATVQRIRDGIDNWFRRNTRPGWSSPPEYIGTLLYRAREITPMSLRDQVE
jgi:orotate phosphoribosyltransferase-like protein